MSICLFACFVGHTLTLSVDKRSPPLKQTCWSGTHCTQTYSHNCRSLCGQSLELLVHSSLAQKRLQAVVSSWGCEALHAQPLDDLMMLASSPVFLQCAVPLGLPPVVWQQTQHNGQSTAAQLSSHSLTGVQLMTDGGAGSPAATCEMPFLVQGYQLEAR